MNRLDKLIAWVSPTRGEARARSRHNIAAYSNIQNNYSNVGPYDWIPVGQTLTGAQSERLRIQARELVGKNSLAKGVIRILTDSVIAKGLFPEPMVRKADGTLHEEFNEMIVHYHKNWARHPEVTGQYDLGAMERMQFASLCRDGEVLYQHIEGNLPHLDHNSHVPYSVEMIESDMLATSVDDDDYVYGVRFDTWGHPNSYALYKADKRTYRSYETKAVPADRIAHLKLVEHPRQVRGETIFKTVMKRLANIEETEETELVAARIAAAIVGVEKTEQGNANGEDFEFAPGSIWKGTHEDEFNLVASNRPNNQVVEFTKSQIRGAAAGLPVGYSSMSKDYNGSYSAQRQELVESYMTYGALSDYFVSKSSRPMYERFLNMAITSGVIKVPLDIDPLTLMYVNFTPAVMPWVDPVKEARANETLVKIGVKSKAKVIREQGDNPMQVQDQVKQEKACDLEQLKQEQEIVQENKKATE